MKEAITGERYKATNYNREITETELQEELRKLKSRHDPYLTETRLKVEDRMVESKKKGLSRNKRIVIASGIGAALAIGATIFAFQSVGENSNPEITPISSTDLNIGNSNNDDDSTPSLSVLKDNDKKVNINSHQSETAEKNQDGSWSLKDPDGQEISTNLPNGFIPDKNLVIQNDLKMNGLNGNLSKYADWDNVIHEVAGYNYDYNDFSPNPDFKSNVQGDMYAWRLFQGEKVEIPGIGKLKGEEGTSVVVLVLNLQPKVIPWDNTGLGQVLVEHGFTATGRIWDAGTPQKIANTEELLLGHWLFRQTEGTPEKSYVGITDNPDNAKKTLFVTVAHRQWGDNENGTPREQFQLLRTDVINFNK